VGSRVRDVSAIGGSAAARLIKQKITPVKARSEEDEITQVLNQLMQTFNTNPPPWLRKALQQKSPSYQELTAESI
jgi:nitrogen fixation protein NifX